MPSPATTRALRRLGLRSWPAFARLTDAEVAGLDLTDRDIDALGLDVDESGGGLLRDADGMLVSWRDAPGDDGADMPATVKAARGGGKRRKKGESGPPTPPNVSRAAARVAKGEGTSADQKLLRQWERARVAIGGAGKDLGRRDLAELARESSKLSRLEARWKRRLESFEGRLGVQRAKVEARLAGRVAAAKDPARAGRQADRARSEFDALAAERRPSASHRSDFMGREMAGAYEVSSAVMGSPTPAIRFVLRSAPKSVRDDPGTRAVFAEHVGRHLYHGRGGTYERNAAGFILEGRPTDPTSFAAARGRAERLIATAMGRPATKAAAEIDAPDATEAR